MSGILDQIDGSGCWIAPTFNEILPTDFMNCAAHVDNYDKRGETREIARHCSVVSEKNVKDEDHKNM